MLMYEYKCGECGQLFTLFRHPDSRNDPAVCPICGAWGIRTYSGPAIIIKSSYAESFPEVDANAPEFEEYPTESRPK